MSAAPRFSTADIARTAQRPEPEQPEPTPGQPVAAAPVEPVVTRETRLIEEDSTAPLFASDAAQGFQHRWDGIQASFIDDPRRAVEEADALVAETMQRLAETFAQQRERLEQQFKRNLDTRSDADAQAAIDAQAAVDARAAADAQGPDADLRAAERRRVLDRDARDAAHPQASTSTEDLRIALRHYRSFFKRLLSV